jgi:spore coat polysaccharide biosynthesis predicted glycosyltransferase SpsG
MTVRQALVEGRMLVVRADASAAGGTGHLMRALALAQAWIDRGGRVRWLLAEAPEPLLQRLLAEGIEVERLATGDGGPIEPGSKADAAQFRAKLAGDPRALGAIDGQWFDADYLAALAPTGERVLAVDDGASLAAYPVALVLNQNAHADRAEYPASDDGRPRYLLGLEHVLLRREFLAASSAGAARAIPARAAHLLVTFGGADPTGMTVKAVEALTRLPLDVRSGLAVRVLVGAANPDSERIHELAHGLEPIDVSVERAIADMPGAIAWADLALSSGGSTIWELAHGGCPTLVVETVPIEERLVAGLRKVELFGHLGRGAELGVDEIAEAISARIGDAGWRRTMSERGRRLVDGRGPDRVIEAMAEVRA